MIELKVKKIGKSHGLFLSKEALAKLNVAEGDSVFLTCGVDGILRLSAGNPEFAKQMLAAEGVIKRYGKTLRELAK